LSERIEFKWQDVFNVHILQINSDYGHPFCQSSMLYLLATSAFPFSAEFAENGSESETADGPGLLEFPCVGFGCGMDSNRRLPLGSI
jgi:hypothetical protein